MIIFLIGFMGSGKSTIGQKLAEKCNLNFIDLDNEIEKYSHQTISSIFQTRGEDFFREIEKEVLSFFYQDTNCILATGGGTPCFFNNLERMNSAGVTFYLKSSTTVLTQRLQSEKNKRPLIEKLNDNELFNFIESKLNERKFFYEKATHIIDTDKKSIEQIVDIMLNLIHTSHDK